MPEVSFMRSTFPPASSSSDSNADLCSSLNKHHTGSSSSIAEHTMVTTAESEYSLAFTSTEDLTEKSHAIINDDDDDDEQHQPEDDGFDDSLSSGEDEGGANRRMMAPKHQEGGPTTDGPTKIPSSLHIPSYGEESAATSDDHHVHFEEKPLEEEKEEEQEEAPVVAVDPEDDLKKSHEEAEESLVSKASKPLKRLSIDMIKYRPSDRSISVALTPSKPLLRRDSSYGKDSKIPLDFNKRGSVRVLPKPDVKKIQQEQIKRLSSAPASLGGAATAVATTTTTTTKKRSISFHSIGIREHKITMGDNPSCSYGTPVSLDWDYIDFEELTLDDYEMHKFVAGRGRPRTLRQLYLNHYQRKNLLQQEGFTLDQIKDVKKETSKVRKQREMTKFLAQAKVLISLEDMVESGRRKVARAITGGGKPSKKEQDKQLLLKIMGGDDTVDAARIVQHESNLMPMSIRKLEG